jgi:hypothetical protein
MSNVINYVASLNAAFDARTEYETSKNAENANMLKNLTSYRKSMTHEACATILMQCNIDANFINRQERINARFNVYAIEKVDNVARFLAKVERLNHYTLAIVKSAIKLSELNMSLTHDDAQSACSSDLKSSDMRKRKHIVHYARVVAKNTASTQSSSSINALQMFDILRETRDDQNNVAYVFNKDHARADDIIAMLA